MRTFTTPAPVPGPASARRTLTRISALGVACAAALALTACSSGGSGGSSKKGSSSTGSATGSFPGAQSSSSASTQPSFDPASGPTMAANQLPKNCDGLVTDADMQLALGNPLNGGDFFQPFQPTSPKQLGRVRCQYGVVQDNTGKVTSNQVEIQLAVYADAATAQSHGAATVGTLAGQGDQYAPVSVGGHPATYVTEPGKDAILVMYDGNRTFLITTQEALVKGDDAKAFTLKIAAALYKHTTPNPAPSSTPSGSASAPASGASSTPGAQPSGAPSSSAPAGQPSPPAGQSSAPAGQPSQPGGKPSAPPSSAPAD